MHTPEPSSGSALYVANLVKALLGADQTVVLLCPGNFAYRAELASAGAGIVDARNRSTAPASFPARVARNLRFFGGMCIRQIRLTRSQDIIHFQFPLYFPAGLIFFLLARFQARAIVYTAHDPVPHKWLLPPLLRFIERACLRRAYTLSDRVIVHHEAAGDLLRRAFAQNLSKIAIIPHGCSARDSADVEFNDSDTLRLLMFGSIREDKGVELAIEAVQRINRHSVQVRLLIAGSVANAREQTYWNKCKRLIERSSNGIEVRERFIRDEEIPRLLADCHAVLLPYRNFDSESGVAAVALGSGRALLATNTGGLASLLKAADLGIAIESPTASAVERAIRQALSTGPRGLQDRGLRGLAYVRSTRSWEVVGKQTASLYAELPIREEVREIIHG